MDPYSFPYGTARNGLLLDYRHRIPLSQHSMNLMRNNTATILFLHWRIFPIKNHRIMVLSALPVSRNCRLIVAGVPRPPIYLDKTRELLILIRALSPAVTRTLRIRKFTHGPANTTAPRLCRPCCLHRRRRQSMACRLAHRPHYAPP